MRVMKARSTQAVVGLCGNDSTMTRGRGQESSHVSIRLAKKSCSGPRRTWRISAPARLGPQMWMGYDGLGTIAASPGPSSTHIRCEKPSLAPIVVQACVSGSSSTPNRRRYRSVIASRSFGMPRLAE